MGITYRVAARDVISSLKSISFSAWQRSEHTCILSCHCMDERINIPYVISFPRKSGRLSVPILSRISCRKGMENSEEWYGKMTDSENTQGKVWKYDPSSSVRK